MDTNFEALLAEQNKTFQDAVPFGNWMPDDGEYTTFISKVEPRVLTDKDTDESYPAWNITFQLATPNNLDIDGKTFEMFCSMRTEGATKMLKGVVQMLANTNSDEMTLTDAHHILISSIGYVCLVQIKTSKKGFKNANIKEVISRGSDPVTE